MIFLGFMRHKFVGPLLEMAEIDHIVAICNGGEHMSLDNLQTLCHKCHAKKSGQDRRIKNGTYQENEIKYKSLEEWL